MAAAKMKKPKRIDPWKPFKPQRQPPPGWYDPTIDVNVRATERGTEDFRQDTARDQERADTDYSLAAEAITRTSGRSFADIMRDRARAVQDYDRDRALRERSFGLLANAQQGAGNAAGLLGGGFSAAARAKRAENQRLEQEGADIAQSRFLEDSGEGERRLGEDVGVARGQLGLDYGRGNQDRQTALGRAERESTFYGQDAAQLRAYEAASQGYIPPERGKLEGKKAGVAYRWSSPDKKWAYLPSGKVVSRQRLKRRIARARSELGG